MHTPARFTPREELANAMSAGSGLMLSVIALFVMVMAVLGNGSAVHMIAAVVFGLSLIALYTTSALNHALPAGPRKEFFHNLDQVAIYVLIAGTYTPLTLISLNGPYGTGIFAAEWVLALGGLGWKLFAPNAFEKGVGGWQVGSYVLMGWLIMLVPSMVYDSIGSGGVFWLLAGGGFYTGGLLFFRMTSVRYHHLLWHLCVIAGSASHIHLVYRFVLPIEL